MWRKILQGIESLLVISPKDQQDLRTLNTLVINNRSSLHQIWKKSQYWRPYVMNWQDKWWALPTVVNLLLVMGSESTNDWRRSRLIARSIRSTSRCRPDIRSLVSMSSSSSVKTKNTRLTKEPCRHHKFPKE